MNILVLNQYALPPGSPGITRHGDLGASLVERGHDVTVVASGFDYLGRERDRTEGRPRRDEVHGGVRFIWLRTGSYSSNDQRRVRSMLRFTASAVRVGLRNQPRPDVVLASSPHLLTGAAGATIARLRSVPFVFEVRDLWPSSLVDLGAIRAGSGVHRALVGLERWLYRRADRIISVPPRGHERVRELGVDPSKCVHIPNAATARSSAAATMPATLKRLFDELGERFVIVYAGAHGVANGLENVLEAVDLLRRERPDAYRQLGVVFIGGGQERSQLMESAAAHRLDNIRFHQPVEKAAMGDALGHASAGLVHVRAARVFDYGLSPNKLFDYLGAEVPVLISSPQPTLVDELGAGITFTPGDPRVLMDAMLNLMALPESKRREMGRRGRQAVEERFSVESITTMLESVLLDVIESGKRAQP